MFYCKININKWLGMFFSLDSLHEKHVFKRTCVRIVCVRAPRAIFLLEAEEHICWTGYAGNVLLKYFNCTQLPFVRQMWMCCWKERNPHQLVMKVFCCVINRAVLQLSQSRVCSSRSGKMLCPTISCIISYIHIIR